MKAREVYMYPQNLLYVLLKPTLYTLKPTYHTHVATGKRERYICTLKTYFIYPQNLLYILLKTTLYTLKTYFIYPQNLLKPTFYTVKSYFIYP
jgi:hypothetical protein